MDAHGFFPSSSPTILKFLLPPPSFAITVQMSWLVRSIADSLKLDDDEDNGKSEVSADDGTRWLPPNDQDGDRFQRGVEEDLSDLSKTLTRQLRGVASFLAPVSRISCADPTTEDRYKWFDRGVSVSSGIDGVRGDLLEIRGNFRIGISKLSSKKAVMELAKIASDFLRFVSEEGGTIEDYARHGVVGVTEEVVDFARHVATLPETWLDFSLPDDEGEEEFDMSDTQTAHALAVERLAPTLAALRRELCPVFMREGSFWKIYFVLVHPRLTTHDVKLLSTSQTAKAREMQTQKLNTKSNPNKSEGDSDTISSTDTPETAVDHHVLATIEIPIIAISDDQKVLDKNQGEDAYDHLNEEPSESDSCKETEVPIEYEDASFSDPEEDDNGDAPIELGLEPPAWCRRRQ